MTSLHWTLPADLREQVQRLWTSGQMLGTMVTGEPLFPCRLRLRSPGSAEMAERFAEVRVWIAALREMQHCRIEMRQFNHRLLGANAVPAEAWIDSMDEAVALAGKKQEVHRFTQIVDSTRLRQPLLLAWLARRPLQALELWRDWSRLLDIVCWLQAHPRPGIYLRQVDLAGVHSKFIESHRAVLSELLDSVLPPGAIEPSASGVSQFARRYGFLDKPLRIRFRMLDPDRRLLPGNSQQDMTLDAESFAQLMPGVSHVFVTENEINFLAFPDVRDSLVLFGAGYGFDVLSDAHWLQDCRIHYWGDIDTHGFAILDQLRLRFGHVESFLMDRATLMAFEAQWGEETTQTLRDLPSLTALESELYDALRDNRLGQRLRLEQERIGFAWVEKALKFLQSEQ